jgi:hypothetical protein
MAKKGRIKKADLEVLHGEADGVVKNGNYTREKKGSKTIHKWIAENGDRMQVIYDPTVFKNGPISIEIVPEGGFSKMVAEADVVLTFNRSNDSLPKTKRKYINPANGKEVGYARAKTLGLIK